MEFIIYVVIFFFFIHMQSIKHFSNNLAIVFLEGLDNAPSHPGRPLPRRRDFAYCFLLFFQNFSSVRTRRIIIVLKRAYETHFCT